MYVFEKDKGRLLTNSGESYLQAKYKYRQQALVAMGPHLFPQTITHWARVVGRQLIVGTADLSYQYACYTLSNTMKKYLNAFASSNRSCSSISKVVSSDVDHDPWPLLASELASCVRRMKPDHTHTLCVTIAGLTLKAADIPLECEMLHPLTNVPDHAVDILISAMCSALQKLALPLATSVTQTPLTSSLASITALYTLSALQARTLLPSILSLKNFILALHKNLPVIHASPMRDAFLRHCLERRVPSSISLGASVEVDNAFVSLLLSPIGGNDVVMEVLTPYCEILGLQAEKKIETGKEVTVCVATSLSLSASTEIATVGSRREGGGEVASTGDMISRMVTQIVHLAAEYCLTNLSKEKIAGGDAVKSILSTSPADTVDLMIRNSHSNFGSLAVGKVISYLHTRLLAISSSHDSCKHADIDNDEIIDSAQQIFLESCLSLSEPCVVFLKEIGAGDTELREVAKMTVNPAVELLTTRMLIAQIGATTLNRHALSNSKSHIGQLSISLRCLEGHNIGSSDHPVTHFYLDSASNRESLFLHIFAAVSEILNELDSAAAVVPVRALIDLLRCWGISKSDGSLQVALEGVTSPQMEGESRSLTDQSNVQCRVAKYPTWMISRFHLYVWGRMISLCERMKLFDSITEMLILDIDLLCGKSMEAAAVAGEGEGEGKGASSSAKELTRQLRDSVTALANNSMLPFDFRCTVRCAMISISNLHIDLYLRAHASRFLL